LGCQLQFKQAGQSSVTGLETTVNYLLINCVGILHLTHVASFLSGPSITNKYVWEKVHVSVEWAGCPDHVTVIENTTYVSVEWAGCPDHVIVIENTTYVSVEWVGCPDHVIVIANTELMSVEWAGCPDHVIVIANTE